MEGVNVRARKPASKYRVGELVVIKKIQSEPGQKLKPKFLGPYRVLKYKGGDSYDLEKVGDGDGPYKTSSCAEYMKRWMASEAEAEQDGRM